MLRKISLGLIRLYQRHMRVCLPYSCRFTPSCSDYAWQAIAKYGFLLGSCKAAKRLLKCHPFSGNAGYDPLT